MICQSSLPFYPWMEPRLARLPGMVPVGMSDWLVRDEAYDGQMACSDRLIEERRLDVAALEGVEAEGEELLALILAQLGDGYRVSEAQVERPDGVVVDLDGDHPLIIARQLVQEDLLIHRSFGDVHGLVGGVLCFPASWTLSEKVGRNLMGLHAPVAEYDAGLGARVQRLFDGIKAGRPMMRANFLTYESPDLFHPRPEANRRHDERALFMRVERQCLVRLPQSGSVVFSIHTYVVPMENLPQGARDQLPKEML